MPVFTRGANPPLPHLILVLGPQPLFASILVILTQSLYIPGLHFLYAIISQDEKAESGKSSPVRPHLPVPTDTVLDLLLT